MNSGVNVKVDLTKKRYALLTDANELVIDSNVAMFCYCDINCRPKVKWNDEGRKDCFFDSIEDLKELLEETK